MPLIFFKSRLLAIALCSPVTLVSAYKNGISQEKYDQYFNFIEHHQKERLTDQLHIGLFPKNYRGESLKVLQEDMVRNCLQEILKKQNIKALDVGCGIGGPIILSLNSNPTLEIDAIELLDGNRARTNKLLLENNLEKRCRLFDMDAHRMSFESHTYDYAFAIESLQNMDQAAAFREIFRVLKGNGKLFFCDFFEKNNLTEGEAALLLTNESITLLTQKKCIRLLKAIGFKDIKIVDLTDRVYLNFEYFYPENKFFRRLIKEQKIGYMRVSAIARKSIAKRPI